MDDDVYRPVHRDPAPAFYGRLRVMRTTDLAPARWLAEHGPAEGDFGTVAGIAVPGFPAYARILHPASLDEHPVRWSAVAAAYGRTVAPTTRWHEVIGAEEFHRDSSVHGLPGVWDEHPWEGPTPPAIAQILLPFLTRHTRTPDDCWFGLWDGYGWLDFDGVPTFETPHRDRVLLSGPLADVASPATGNDDIWAELPDLWWPQDRAWCVGGDVDLVGTYIGGCPELIAEVLAAPGLEAHPVFPGDPVN
ncbi:hypothetical protein [Streptomyces jumonjinensis]|uniref:Uncharacterized protein n=1 Tax=Streptomyces jumonjinensis TaxID=1945 RepID=A0A646KT97_STRJU|nr:hypothetical protein [Streptomyces jumonjinensis]MQT05539.1 hypothetical protein [Streptomyces jumonjinensis]